MRAAQLWRKTAWLAFLAALLLGGSTFWPGLPRTTTLSVPWPAFADAPTAGGSLRIVLRQPTGWLWGQRPTLRLHLAPSPSPDHPLPPTLRLEARLEVTGLNASPDGPQTLRLAPQGDPINLTWRLQAPVPGPYRGRLWLRVAAPNPANAPEVWRSVAVLPLRGTVWAPAGQPVDRLRAWAGGLLLLAGVAALGSRFFAPRG